MEDLQDALQSILSDPEQMARVAALAESLGLKPPDNEATGNRQQATGNRQQAIGETSGSSAGAVIGRLPDPPFRGEAPQNCHSKPCPEQGRRGSEESAPPSPFTGSDGINLGQVMNLLSTSSGSEIKVLSALRSTMDPEGQTRVDRALRAAKLSRLAGTLLAQRRTEHV